MYKSSMLSASLVVLATLFITPAIGYASQALVVGINHYPGLREGNQSYDLTACVDDARAMAEKLHTLGFKVALLTDEKATHDGIFSAVQEIGKNIRSGERFVFYFAGQGNTTRHGDSCLLPADASIYNEDKNIGAAELYNAISKLPSRSRTVILDAAHSAGMIIATTGNARDAGATPQLVTHPIEEPAKKDAEDLNAPEQCVSQPVCYLTAARAGEQPLEERFDETMHEIFTYSLLQNLTDKPQRWQELFAKMTKDMAKITENLQHPFMSTGYEKAFVFEEPK